jgi:hypothetical protein
MAHPIMFSATMTGPEMEKMEPCWSSPASTRVRCLPEGAMTDDAGGDKAGVGGVLAGLSKENGLELLELL